jgi:Uma2 family endonuclease
MRTVVPWAEDVLMTAGELLLLPDDAWRYELVDGRLVRMAPTGSEHGEITAEVVLAVGQFVKERRLGTVYTGEPGYWISAPGSPDTVLAPDLAVEVVSPSQARSEMAAKAERWLEAGVRLVWLVYPQIKQVEVWRDGTMKTVLTIEDELSGEDVLPGFALPIKDLFP